MTDGPTTTHTAPPSTRRDELLTFLLLTVVIAPAFAVAFVGFYGLCVWIYQAFAGPPGSPLV